MEATSSVGHRPKEGERWKFDASVSACFDDMAVRSIPLYRETIDLCCRLALRHCSPAGPSVVLDLGCATGNTMVRMCELAAEEAPKASLRFIGLDAEQTMLDRARARLGPAPHLAQHDLRTRLPYLAFAARPQVVFLLWTAQFVPIEHRARLLADIREAIAPDGVLLVAEKLRGQSAAFQRALADEYAAFKSRSGYSREDIEAKASALEGSLVSLCAPEQKAFLHAEGFAAEEVIRYLGFAAWYCLPR